MLHETWQNNDVRKVKVVNTEAEKYKVDSMLTVGKTYTVVNETEEYIFVIDNSSKVGGYYKSYFENL